MVPSKSCSFKKTFKEKVEKGRFLQVVAIINVMFKKIEEEELVFNPIPYIEDEEQYFSNLVSWKNNFEEQLLNKHPYLTRSPIRHRKIYRHVKVILIR